MCVVYSGGFFKRDKVGCRQSLEFFLFKTDLNRFKTHFTALEFDETAW